MRCDVGVDDVGQLIALPGEASDVVIEGLIRLLSIVLKVLGVPRTRVGALKFPIKISFRSAQPLIEFGRRWSSHIRAELARNNGRLWMMK
jgi:hypothetical protein